MVLRCVKSLYRSFSLFFGGVRGSLCRRRYLIRRIETGKDTQEAGPGARAPALPAKHRHQPKTVPHSRAEDGALFRTHR